jgi:5'-3' exonuclease
LATGDDGKRTVDYDWRVVVDQVIRTCEMLVSAKITPLLVLDGGSLPGKSAEQFSRADRREEAARDLTNHLKAGGSDTDAHGKKLIRRMAGRTAELMDMLKVALAKRGIPFLVSPYEADAQLVHLEQVGATNGTITGDADLQVFGGKVVAYDVPGDRLTRTQVYVVRQQDIMSQAAPAVAAGDSDTDPLLSTGELRSSRLPA